MWGQASDSAGSNVGVQLAQWCLTLKLLWWAADYSIVQRSALVAGLSLALTGLTLAGVGEWAGGRFDASSADGRSAGSLENSNYAQPAVTTSLLRMPDLPDAGDSLPAATPGYTFRHDVPEVRLQFTVADERGRLVRDLTASDVEVFDDQSQVKRFSDFERDDNLPLQLGMVLDTSDSVKRVLPQEKRAAADFLDRVMRPQTDVAYVMAAAGEVKTWQNSTTNRQELVDAIDRLKEPGWGTRIFDALYSACSQTSENAEGKNLHRAIIVLTDGYDTDSLHTFHDVIAAAERSEIQVYPLTIHSTKVVTRGDRVLSYLAQSTGGRFYVANSAKDLDSTFAEIEQDLRTQYYVSFPPQEATPGYHSLRVAVRSPRKLEIHARQGYYALTQ
jgi:VWFA-related protein